MLLVKIDNQMHEIPYTDGTYQAGSATVTVESNLVTIARLDNRESFEIFTEDSYDEATTQHPVNF